MSGILQYRRAVGPLEPQSVLTHARLRFADIARFAGTEPADVETERGYYHVRPHRLKTGAFVYFIRSQCARKLVKIGTTRDVAARLRELQVGNAYELSIIALVFTLNGREAEAEFHERFKRAHVRGEWFESTVEIEALCAWVRARKTEVFSNAGRGDTFIWRGIERSWSEKL